MRRLKKLSVTSYFTRIVALLVVLITILYVPFFGMTFNAAKRNITNSIEVSNRMVLSQLSQNYGYYFNNCAQLCLSTFWQTDVQRLLYSRGNATSDSYLILKQLYDTILMNNPTIHSLVLYNQAQKKAYSVASTGQLETEEFIESLSQRKELPLLRPLMNTVSSKFLHADTPQNVLSYFMYQYGDPLSGNVSYLVLNQYTDLSVRTIGSNMQSSDKGDATIFLVDDTNLVSSIPLMPEEAEDYEQVIQSFRQKRKDLSEHKSSYVETVGNRKYYVSYLDIERSDTALVMVQSYDLVFKDVLKLQRDFISVFLCLFAASVILVYFVSKSMYSPIGDVLEFFSKYDKQSIPHKKGANELEYIKNIYQKANEQSETLTSMASQYAPIALQYRLHSLLLRSTPENAEQLRALVPNHWLLQPNCRFRVILIKTVSAEHKSASPDDVLLYAVQNIAEELLGNVGRAVTFKSDDKSIGLIVGACGSELSTEPDAYKNAAQTLCDAVETHFFADITVAISNEGCGLEALGAAYRQATQFLGYEFIFNHGVIDADKCALNEHNAQSEYSAELSDRLEQALQAGDHAQLVVLLDEIKAVLSTFTSNNALVCVGALLARLNTGLPQHNDADSVQSVPFSTFYRQAIDAGSLDSCFGVIHDYINGCFSPLPHDETGKDELFTTSVMEFIHQTYDNPLLSSQLIAETLGISNRYLMKKFKALTGSTLNDYIVNFRMKKAASLLLYTDDSIQVIAEKIGIFNANYFYKLFKKAYGCTPREFWEATKHTKKAVREHTP